MEVIGIDLGTVNSCVEIFHNDKLEIITNERGNRMTPSIIAFSDEGILVGDLAKDQQKQNPTNTIYNIKRFLGRKYNDPFIQKDITKYPFKIIPDSKNMIQFEVRLRGETRHFYPEELVALLLTKLKTDAEKYLSKKVTSILLSVPSCFDYRQRESMLNAAKIARLNVIQLISDPIAASMTIFREKRDEEERHALVIDVGGGTFDASIIAIDSMLFENKGTIGSSNFGGENFIDELFQYCINFLRDTEPEFDIENQLDAKMNLRELCENAKQTLSTETSATIDCDSFLEKKGVRIDLSRSLFDNLNEDNYKVICDHLSKLFEFENTPSAAEITDIYLLGGCSQIPGIQKVIYNFLNGKNPRAIDANIDELVASGAAFYASCLANKEVDNKFSVLVIDVSSISLGTQTPGQIFVPYIPRNTPIPARKSHTFSVFMDNDTEIEVFMFQGEQFRSTDDDMIEKVIASNIPPAKVLEASVEFVFNVDLNGILNISINGTMNGKTLETLHLERLRNAFLTDKQVEDLAEAFQSLLN